MNDDVERAEYGSRSLNQVVDLLIGSDVAARDQRRTQLRGQGIGMALARLALVGETDSGTLTMQRLCNAPGDRTIAGEADDQGVFSLEKCHDSFAFAMRLMDTCHLHDLCDGSRLTPFRLRQQGTYVLLFTVFRVERGKP